MVAVVAAPMFKLCQSVRPDSEVADISSAKQKMANAPSIMIACVFLGLIADFKVYLNA